MAGILPFVGQQPLYDMMNFDGAFQSGLGMARPENKKARETFIATYLCPSDYNARELQDHVWQTKGRLWAPTCYAGVVGPHSPGGDFPPSGNPDVPPYPDCHNYTSLGIESCSGLFWRHSWIAPVTIRSITDGLSQTIAVGECVPEFNDFRAWALGNGVHQRTNAPINYTTRLFDPNDPHKVAFNGWPYSSYGSRHAGGAHFSFADGHVVFISDLIEMRIYYGITTRDMGESVPKVFD